jgi:hypothetical protein
MLYQALMDQFHGKRSFLLMGMYYSASFLFEDIATLGILY